MQAKYGIGDILTVNGDYLREGKAYFGKNLNHKNFCGAVLKVFENTNDEKDGFGDVWSNFYEFNDGLQICERFLRRV